MAVYVARKCPKCGSYSGVEIANPIDSGYKPIHGRRAIGDYETAWALFTT
jgi:hypothetical protein